MPFIEIKTNQTVSAEQSADLKGQLGKAITTLPGKSERWLMQRICAAQDMGFAGSELPCAIAEIKLFGQAPDEAIDQMTAKVCNILSAALNIPTNRIYVKYEFCSHWGVDGENF